MRKACIAIDNWKLSIFKKMLDREGFKYTKCKGLTPGTLFLNVETNSITELQPFVIEANNEAARSRNKKLH